MKKKLLFLLLFISLMLSPRYYQQLRRDSYVPTKVVYLYGPNKRGSCSGIHVNIEKATYLLSAAHCLALATNGKILVQDDKMDAPIPREVLMEDSQADIILLEALPNRSGLSLAASVRLEEHLYTYTHGLGYATYKTEGVYIQDKKIEVPLFLVDEKNKCDTTKPKFVEKMMDFFFFKTLACFLVEDTLVTNAFVAPGSSGGAVTNKYGEIVGLVSAGDGQFGYLVTLKDLQRFVSNWK